MLYFVQQLTSPKKSKSTVVIIGGGFAGSTAASKLESEFEVLLFDNKDYFEFTPSVPRIFVEPTHADNIQIPHTHYLHSTKVIRDTVISMSSSEVTTSSGSVFPFDYAIICTGAHYNNQWSQHKNVFLPLIEEQFKEKDVCYQLNKASKVLVIGGGTVGVEIVGEILDEYTDKHIVLATSSDRLLPRAPPAAIRAAENYMTENKVEVLFNERVCSKEGNLFTTTQGTTIEAEIAFVCTGIIPNTHFLKEHFSDDLNERGYVHVNEYLQLSSRENIFVAGDVALIDEEKLAQSAQITGDIAARNIQALSKQHTLGGASTLTAYSPKSLPIVVSLGKYEAIWIYGKYSFAGAIAALLKEFVEWIELIPFY